MRIIPLTAPSILAVATTALCGGTSRGDELFASENRFYLAPIIGASWGTLLDDSYDSVANQDLFTAGGAGGVAFARERGQLRMEFEGRYRDSFGISQGSGPVQATLNVTDNWSAMVNLWRDFSITDRLGIYGGGGIGGGGYGLNFDASVIIFDISGSSRLTQFAWQAGGGVLYALSERITLDLGYRFYNVGFGDTTLVLEAGGVPLASQTITTSFATSEMLLSVRIYEPFRSWR